MGGSRQNSFLVLVMLSCLSGCIDGSKPDTGKTCEPSTPLLPADAGAPVFEINYGESCDCLTIWDPNEEEGDAGTGQPRRQSFCTVPCSNYLDCTRSTTCHPVFPESAALPKGVTHHYCVPTCLIEGCPKSEEVCTAPTGDRTEWYCSRDLAVSV